MEVNLTQEVLPGSIPEEVNEVEKKEEVVVAYPGATNTTSTNEELIVTVSEKKVYSKKNSLSVKTFDELAKEGENLPELKKVFGNHILEGTTILFPAERGVGKTFLSLQIAIAVAEGYDEFLGEKIEVHGNVLYLNMELSEDIMRRRLNKLKSIVEKKEGNPHEAICITSRQSISEIQPYLEKVIQEKKPVLVIVDNLRTAFSDANNEKNNEMTKMITELNNLRDEYTFALVLVHHTKKGTFYQRTNSDLQSGAGAITDLVDGDFFLRRSQHDQNMRLLKRAKSRNCEEQEGSKLLKFNSETHWFEVESENVNEEDHIFVPDSPKAEQLQLKKEAIRLRGEGKTMDEIADALDKNKSTISRWLKGVSVAAKPATEATNEPEELDEVADVA